MKTIDELKRYEPMLKALRDRITTEYKYILNHGVNDLQLNDGLDLLDIIDCQGRYIAELKALTQASGREVVIYPPEDTK